MTWTEFIKGTFCKCSPPVLLGTRRQPVPVGGNNILPRLIRVHPPFAPYPPHKWTVEEPVHHGPLHRQRVCAAPRKRAPATVVAPATAGTQREAIMAKTKVRGIAGARRAKSRNDRNGCQPLAGMEFRKRALPPSEGSSNFMTPALRRHKAYSWRLTPVPCSAHKN